MLPRIAAVSCMLLKTVITVSRSPHVEIQHSRCCQVFVTSAVECPHAHGGGTVLQRAEGVTRGPAEQTQCTWSASDANVWLLLPLPYKQQ
jgi:hypothetical protein